MYHEYGDDAPSCRVSCTAHAVRVHHLCRRIHDSGNAGRNAENRKKSRTKTGLCFAREGKQTASRLLESTWDRVDIRTRKW